MNGLKKVVNIINKIISILDSNDRKKAVLILIDIIIAAMLETAGVGLIIPLISAIATPEQLMQNYIITNLMKTIKISTTSELIIFIGLFLILFYIFKNFFLILSSYVQNRFRFNLQTKLSVKMLKAYLSHPYQFFVNTNSSEIMRGIGADVGCVKDALEVIFNTLTQGLTLILIAVFLIYTDVLMALVFLALSFMCMYFLIFGLKNKVSVLGAEQREGEAKTTKYSRELLDGIKDIYAVRKQDKFLKTYEKAFSLKSKVNIAYYTILDMPNRIIETSFILGIVAIIFVRSYMGVNMALFVSRLAAFALAGIKILPSMSTISKSVTQLIFQKPGIDETYDNIVKYSNMEYFEQGDAVEKEEFKVLEFKNVKWRYNDEDGDIINDVSLTINAGESIAFIGGSGSGKTTMVDLILGLFKPQSGSVEINCQNVSEYKGNWNKLISYVQQNVFLLDDTIRKNIAFGEDDSEIDDDRVWKALEAAQLDDFIKASDAGLDTIVGERGVKFSGGQRQRVAIARALYFDSDIIIFDEATAALDNTTEKAVMEAIDALHGKKTLIIVAHRLSTIKNCDHIYEVSGGKIYHRTWEEISQK